MHERWAGWQMCELIPWPWLPGPAVRLFSLAAPSALTCANQRPFLPAGKRV